MPLRTPLISVEPFSGQIYPKTEIMMMDSGSKLSMWGSVSLTVVYSQCIIPNRILEEESTSFFGAALHQQRQVGS